MGAVLHGTKHLDRGRLPIYIYDLDNATSAFVCRSLGYQLYGEGTTASPYYWVWVPAGTTVVPPPPLPRRP